MHSHTKVKATPDPRQLPRFRGQEAVHPRHVAEDQELLVQLRVGAQQRGVVQGRHPRERAAEAVLEPQRVPPVPPGPLDLEAQRVRAQTELLARAQPLFAGH